MQQKGKTWETTEYRLSKAIIQDRFYGTHTVPHIWEGPCICGTYVVPHITEELLWQWETVDTLWKLSVPYSDCQSVSQTVLWTLSVFFGALSVICSNCGATLGLASFLSLELEAWGSWFEREIWPDPMDSIPPSAWVMIYEGSKFVLVKTKEEVLLSLFLFVRYIPVPFISLPT